MKSLLLRRTKDQKMKSGEALVKLPAKNFIIHELKLGEHARKLYVELYCNSQKEVVEYVSSKDDNNSTPQASSIKQVKRSTIFVRLLRLRQCCSHPVLTTEEPVEEELKGESIDLDLESAMKELDIQESKSEKPAVLTPAEDVSSVNNSCKIVALLENIRKIKSSDEEGVKFVVVSEWTLMLKLIAKALTAEGLTHYTIRHSMPHEQLADMVVDFNTNPSSPQVMLIPLKAGGTGLIGASHLFIMDLHWNPALEQQALGRIHQIGQKKDVVIHKFVCKDTIEQKIHLLQKFKTEAASNALTSATMTLSKLNLKDLKMLFDI